MKKSKPLKTLTLTREDLREAGLAFASVAVVGFVSCMVPFMGFVFGLFFLGMAYLCAGLLLKKRR